MNMADNFSFIHFIVSFVPFPTNLQFFKVDICKQSTSHIHSCIGEQQSKVLIFDIGSV